MRYLADDGSQELSVWNSRDGVTPFVISLPSGRGATHVDWHQDRYDPTHVPAVGDWIFVDLTEERALQAARRNAQRFWDDPTLPARQSFSSVEDLAASVDARSSTELKLCRAGSVGSSQNRCALRRAAWSARSSVRSTKIQSPTAGTWVGSYRSWCQSTWVAPLPDGKLMTNGVTPSRLFHTDSSWEPSSAR